MDEWVCSANRLMTSDQCSSGVKIKKKIESQLVYKPPPVARIHAPLAANLASTWTITDVSNFEQILILNCLTVTRL